MTEIDAKALEAARWRLGLMVGSLRQGNYLPSSLRGAYGRELDFPEVASKCADDIALVLATVTPRGEGRPAIKPLDWEGFGFRWSAETPFGLYRVEADVGVDGAMWHSPCYGGEIRTAPSIPAAKSAAFARYEATILSTLLPAEAVIEAYNETHSSQTAVSEAEDEGLESRAALTTKLHHAIGGRLYAEEALADVADTLREVLEAYSDNTGAEPSQSVFDRAIDHAREVLAALARAGGR